MIKVKDIHVSYDSKKVLHGVNLAFSPDEFLFILGPNGAGKSTLIKCINGIKSINKGDITIQERSIQEWDNVALAREIAFIPQEFYLQFDYTVRDFVMMGRFPWLGYFRNYTDRDDFITQGYIDKLDLKKLQDRLYNSLSGGEKQRVLIARALVQETKVILMDESLSSLDIYHQIDILQLLKEINETEHKSIIMISHDLNQAVEYAKRMVFLSEGQVVADGTPEEVFHAETLQKVFRIKVDFIKNPFSGKNNMVYNV